VVKEMIRAACALAGYAALTLKMLDARGDLQIHPLQSLDAAGDATAATAPDSNRLCADSAASRTGRTNAPARSHGKVS
jgi:hypothetical protein